MTCAVVHRKLLHEIRATQLRFLGLVMMKEDQKDLAMTGKIKGKRSWGRRRMIWTSGLTNIEKWNYYRKQ